jgi:hypothetical protein
MSAPSRSPRQAQRRPLAKMGTTKIVPQMGENEAAS